MASSHIAALIALTVIITATTAAAKSAAPPPVDCTSVVLSMADCLSYVTNGSNVEKPEGNCCSGLKSVLKSNPDCLCEAFKSSSQFGVVLNVTKALALPSACHVHAPSPTNCGLSLSPAGAPVSTGGVIPPAGAPSSSASSIANPPSSSFGASASTPAAAPGSKPSSSSAVDISVKLVVAMMTCAFFYSF